MLLTKLSLDNFRNFGKKTIEFKPKINIIVGSNAAGKTNILESIYLISTGKSFKARLEEEMISYNTDISRVKGQVVSQEDTGLGSFKLEIVLTRGEIQIGDDPETVQKAPRKKMLVNEVPRRLIDFSGKLITTLFGPWDLDLVTESPSLRRKFLDSVISQTNREYRRAAMSYEKGLRQRNKLLFRIREEGLPRSQLLFWDRLLIKNGDYISNARREFIEFVNSQKDFLDQDFSLLYDPSAISEARLLQYKNEEVASATTLVGPHRDDFLFEIKTPQTSAKRDLAKYGSRGEQRMGVLWLKMAELSFVEKIAGERPVLLLDDIFSELDHKHRTVVSELAEKQQTIITTADVHYIEGFKKVEKISLKL